MRSLLFCGGVRGITISDICGGSGGEAYVCERERESSGRGRGIAGKRGVGVRLGWAWGHIVYIVVRLCLEIYV